ncbi:hypothetical protein ACHAXT_012634 [Thalassiosira profunda]
MEPPYGATFPRKRRRPPSSCPAVAKTAPGPRHNLPSSPPLVYAASIHRRARDGSIWSGDRGHRRKQIWFHWAVPFRIRTRRGIATIIAIFLGCTGVLSFNGHPPVSSRRIEPTRRGCITHAAPKVSFNLDEIEEGFVREQSSQPNTKSIGSNSKSGKKGSRKVKPTLPTEPTADVAASRKRRNRSASVTKMPPWLAQYEDGDLAGFYLPEESAAAAFQDTVWPMDDRGDTGEERNTELTEMQRLQLALNGIFHHPAMASGYSPRSVPDAIAHFTPVEIHDVLDAVRVASHGNAKLMAGCAEFLYLMLTLEEEGVLTSDFLSNEPWDDDDIGTAANEYWQGVSPKRTPDEHQPHSIMTKDVLVAAAFHYCDCVRARRMGVYDFARQAMEASLDQRMWSELESKQLFLPPAKGITEVGESKVVAADTTLTPAEDNTPRISNTRGASNGSKAPIEKYGDESSQIAAGAARLKKAEIMSAIVQSSKGPIHRSDDDSEILRSFLVSLSEDWRALVIRSAACLYRLKGIASEQEYAGSMALSTSTIATAKEAFRVYAPLAQRLGMQRLKTELENTAFRILYPRQYSVASSLYDIEEMKSIVLILSSRIEQLLRSDPIFHEQLEDVTVSSRVKEPYSLWRKLLRYRASAEKKEIGPVRQALSLKWVPDAIALRVIISARSQSPLEDEESLRTREKMLCYYALQLISDVWPASTSNVAKDYIKNPKANGYQSLHYTANLMISGQEWPFEVQIRSEEMHRVAEFGVAAHWDYKLQTKVIKSLPEKSVSGEESQMRALPAAGNCTIIATEKESVTVEVNITDTSDDPSTVRKKGRVASYIEALSTSRETLVQSNRFIFVSSTSSALDGRMVSIQSDASSVADVLEEYGDTINAEGGGLEIFLNGIRCISLTEQLSNGDVLTASSSSSNVVISPRCLVTESSV